jgi:tetratricopeptide (TPR) repeat protein
LGERLELSDLRHALKLQAPAELQRWLYNPRERTELGLRRLRAEGPDEALAAFETAGRVAPEDREVLFNLGTARLLADHGDAVGALERAVAGADGEGAPRGPALDPHTLQRAYYNLGGARLAGGDAAGAVAAFEEALRRDPADAGAKFNLELALRRLEAAKLRLKPPQESPEGKRPGEDETSEETGGTRPEAEPDASDTGGRDPGGEDGEAETRPQDDAAAGRRPLAGFEEQRDLSAAQAAALLEAVENLERHQRLLDAERTARAAGAAEEEDW